jgi:hypothetical protein
MSANQNTSSNFDKLFFECVILPCLIFFVPLLLLAIGGITLITIGNAKGDTPISTAYEDWGTVTSVGACRAGKYSYRCRIDLSSQEYLNLDVSDLPGGQIEVGDRLKMRTLLTPSHWVQNLCVNDVCTSAITFDSCAWWSDCYDEKVIAAKHEVR